MVLDSTNVRLLMFAAFGTDGYQVLPRKFENMQSILQRWCHVWLASAAALAFSAPALAAAPAPVSYTVVHANFACQTATCDGELWLPKGVSKPPVIIMAHGFGALKDWGLQPFAERFVKAGFAVMRFDYRGFGKSGGQPRRVVDGPEHVKDWLAAIDSVPLAGDVGGARPGLCAGRDRRRGCVPGRPACRAVLSVHPVPLRFHRSGGRWPATAARQRPSARRCAWYVSVT